MTTKKPDYDHIYKLVREYYVQQLLLTKELYEHQYNELERIDNPRVSSLYHLMLSIYLTGSAINLLALNNYLGESYMLARALLEKLINYMYLLVCEEGEYKKYLDYTKQRGYRVLNRSFIAGNQKVELKWGGSVNLDDYPELKEAISQFTSSKGKAVTRWTSLSLADRLNVIGEKATINITGLMFSMLGIYEDASEALHGSLYGATFNYGFFGGKKPSNTKEFAETYRNQLLTLFFALGTSIASLFKVISRVYPTKKVKEFAQQSGNNFGALGKYIDNNIPEGRESGG
jgi:hypothetical protein